jgi:N-acetylmuramoyl-L-alanine amidase
MPNVLIETGFINNPEEEDYLNSANGQGEIVSSIVKAIGEYKNEVDSK